MEITGSVLQIITNVIIILLFAGLIVLVFNLIKNLKALAGKIEDISKDIVEIKPKIETSLEKVNALSDNLSVLFTNVNGQVDKVGIVVNKFTETANDVLDFTSQLQGKVRPPLLEGASTIAAISSGVKTFFDVWNSGKERRLESKQRKQVKELTESMEEFNKELEEVNTQLADLKLKD